MGQKEHKMLQYVPQLARGTPRRRRESINAAAARGFGALLFLRSAAGQQGGAMRRNLQNLQITRHRSIVLGFPIGDLGMSDCFAVCLSSSSRSACAACCLLPACRCLPACCFEDRRICMHIYYYLLGWLHSAVPQYFPVPPFDRGRTF